MEWKDLAFGVQSMVWQDPSATLRKTGRQEDRKTGRQEDRKTGNNNTADFVS